MIYFAPQRAGEFRLRRAPWKDETKDAELPQFVLDGDPTAKRLSEFPTKAQTHARSAVLARSGAVELAEVFEDRLRSSRLIPMPVSAIQHSTNELRVFGWWSPRASNPQPLECHSISVPNHNQRLPKKIQ